MIYSTLATPPFSLPPGLVAPWTPQPGPVLASRSYVDNGAKKRHGRSTTLRRRSLRRIAWPRLRSPGNSSKTSSLAGWSADAALAACGQRRSPRHGTGRGAPRSPAPTHWKTAELRWYPPSGRTGSTTVSANKTPVTMAKNPQTGGPPPPSYPL